MELIARASYRGALAAACGVLLGWWLAAAKGWPWWAATPAGILCAVGVFAAILGGLYAYTKVTYPKRAEEYRRLLRAAAQRRGGQPVRAVLFDLDGTLTDTFELWYQAVAELVRRHSGRELDREEYRQKWWGMDGRNKVRQLLGADGRRVEELYRELVQLLMEKVPLVRCFDGVGEAVDMLAQRFPLAVISNGPMEFLRAQLRQVGLLDKFSALIADAEPKPSPEGILRACRQLSVRPEEAVFVGDSRFDVEAGQRAGVRTLIVGRDADTLRAIAEGLLGEADEKGGAVQ